MGPHAGLQFRGGAIRDTDLVRDGPEDSRPDGAGSVDRHADGIAASALGLRSCTGRACERTRDDRQRERATGGGAAGPESVHVVGLGGGNGWGCLQVDLHRTGVA